MATGTMTSKGQVTIPREVRDDLGLTRGTRVSFTRNTEGDYVLRREQQSVRSLAGCLKWDGPAKSLEEMEAGIAAGASEPSR